jgi:hypothetical protein
MNNEITATAAASNNSIYPAEWLTKKYTIQIADNTGHTTVDNLLVEEAVEQIVKNAESNARWVFINGAKFEFDNGGYRTQENLEKLKNRLEEQLDPVVLLTGILVGG